MPYTLTDLLIDCATGIGLVVMAFGVVIGVSYGLDRLHVWGLRRGWWRLLSLLLIVLLPSSAVAQEARTVYPAFIGAHVADFHSTHVAESVGLVEMNPLMKWKPLRYTLKPLLAAGVIVKAEQLRKDGHPRKAFWLMVGHTAAIGTVSYVNYWLAISKKELR